MTDNLAGAFKCSEHNFSTSQQSEWREHLGDKEHIHRGSSKCVTCGDMIENYTWKGKLNNGKTYPVLVCKRCKEQ